ncbi:SAM-dependent methyltransferase [Streptomyces sp. NPDC001933]|uniref:SAM-dependent methyltransferase n=1 Tax=Streptomyces sp. NPDC001933 TaxID=3364626 RepID=UPI0036AE9048
MPDSPDWASVPSSARIANLFTGGTNNYEVDRLLAQQLRQVVAWLPQMLLINRHFGQRAVEHMAGELGLTQFLDLGCGLPFNPDARPEKPLHTYDAARRFCDPRVAYIDSNPMVHGHANVCLAEHPGTAPVHADMRQVDHLLANPALLSVVNVRRPVAVLGNDLFAWMSDEDAARCIADLHDRLAPGSALSVSHASTDTDPDAMTALTDIYAEHGIVFRPRTREHIRRLLGPWEPVSPGIVATAHWPKAPQSLPGADQSHSYATVARRTDVS